MADIVILGAGPAGLAAGAELALAGKKITIIEQQDHVGGNATSFNFGGINVDYGSHRLHPAANREVLDKIRNLLGDDLLTRPRHGRIRLMGRWIHFPLRPIDLLLRMHPRFAIGVLFDMLSKIFKSKSRNQENETFATILKKGLGNTICKEFYFPYAKKIWGLDPAELSPIQARKRVSAGSIGKMIKRLLPGGSGGANTKGIFYYPRYGFGQITQALKDAASDAGAEIILGASVKNISRKDGISNVTLEKDGEISQIKASQIYSTIPVSTLISLLAPSVPVEIINAANSLEFRSMVLVYLQLDQEHFTEFDAHYFPGSDIPFTRISETKNYTDIDKPRDKTVLCAEVPCFENDEIWSMNDEDLGLLVTTGLKKAGIPVETTIGEIKTKRISHAYPLYRIGYEKRFELIDSWVNEQDGVLSFGRQGLYAHDNTHHAIYMAMAAVRCTNDDNTINSSAWNDERKVFESHVVED